MLNNEEKSGSKIIYLFNKNEDVCDERRFFHVKIWTAYSIGIKLFFMQQFINNKFNDIEKIKNIIFYFS